MLQKLLATGCVGLAMVAMTAQSPPLPSGNGLIVGRVVDADTGRGVSDVAVTPALLRDVTRGGSIAILRGILTDADGRFVLRGLPAGSYLITARRSGYVEGFYGARAPRGEGKPILIGEDGRSGNASIRLWKLAALESTVVDEAGETIVGLQLRAFKRNLVAGRWRFGEYYSNIKYDRRTDDRDVYRIADLEPEDYIVSMPLTTAVAPASAVAELVALRNDPGARAAYTAATAAFSASGAPIAGQGSSNVIGLGDLLMTVRTPGLAPVARGTGPALIYQTQYLANATAANLAQTISVKAGEERGGADFVMTPVRAWQVSGTVTGPGGPAAGLSMRIVRADGDTVLQETEVAATVSDTNGDFTFVGVPTGQYTVRVMQMAQLPSVGTQVGVMTCREQGVGASAEPTLWANLSMSVGEADVGGLSVTLRTGVRITG